MKIVKLIKNSGDISFFIKSYITSLGFFLWLFLLSFMSFSIYYSSELSESYNSSLGFSSHTYTIYKDSDPVIAQIELFLAQNQFKLTNDELVIIEKRRQDRITELMAKKYLEVINQLN